MRAAVVDRYGPPEVVRVIEVPRPEPRAGEVLVRVEAVAVTSGDARIRAARFPPGFGFVARPVFGLRRPRRRILGMSMSGVVDSVGPGVTAFHPGDEVCGMTGTRMGAHAEYVVVPAGKLARKPTAVSHDDAAGLLFGGGTALHFLRDKYFLRDKSPRRDAGAAGVGRSVLVNGAAGAVGTNAVQLARHFGATVTAVTSAANVDLVRRLGADRVIDHTSEGLDGAGPFDLVLDVVGNLTIRSGRQLLSDNGVLVLAVASLGQTIRARGNVVAGSAPERVADVEFLLDLVADGTITVVQDESYRLDTIADAHRRVDSGHKLGNVVVRP